MGGSVRVGKVAAVASAIIWASALVVSAKTTSEVVSDRINPETTSEVFVTADTCMACHNNLISRTGETLGTNTGWETAPDPAEITAAANQVGAFAFAAGSKDSAMVMTLAPGVYTAQITGSGNATGVALVEVYSVGE